MLGAYLSPLLAQVSREEFGRGFRGATSQLHWTDILPYAAAFTFVADTTAILLVTENFNG